MASSNWNDDQPQMPTVPGTSTEQSAEPHAWHLLPQVDIHQALQPLLKHLHHYDAKRLKLEQEGGRLADLNKIAAILSQKIILKGRFREGKVALTDQAALRLMLSDIGNCDLHLSVRQLSTRLPVYYLCRIRRDFWSEYSLIVEDIYRSPGYPITDDRFVKLMYIGHETYHLRLSQFRDRVAQMVSQDGDDGDALLEEVDEILYRLGRHVFQAAWHEDQQVGVLAATHFNLPCFRQAIELLYLCLSGELCELRSVINEPMLRLFEDVYPQPAIRAFLEQLAHLDGGALNDVPQRALKLYAALSKAFGCFLRVEVSWGCHQAQVPIYKLVFGNLSRLELVGKALSRNQTVMAAGARLEAEAQKIIAAIITIR
jgi:hypothetical protein